MKRKQAERWIHPTHARGIRSHQASIAVPTFTLTDKALDGYVRDGTYTRRAWYRSMAKILQGQPRFK